MPKTMCRTPKPSPSIAIWAVAGSTNVNIPRTTNTAPMTQTKSRDRRADHRACGQHRAAVKQQPHAGNDVGHVHRHQNPGEHGARKQRGTNAQQKLSGRSQVAPAAALRNLARHQGSPEQQGDGGGDQPNRQPMGRESGQRHRDRGENADDAHDDARHPGNVHRARRLDGRADVGQGAEGAALNGCRSLGSNGNCSVRSGHYFSLSERTVPRQVL